MTAGRANKPSAKETKAANAKAFRELEERVSGKLVLARADCLKRAEAGGYEEFELPPKAMEKMKCTGGQPVGRITFKLSDLKSSLTASSAVDAHDAMLKNAALLVRKAVYGVLKPIVTGGTSDTTDWVVETHSQKVRAQPAAGSGDGLD